MSSAVWSGEVRISDVDKENDSMLQFSPIVAKRKSIMSTTTNALTTSNASNAQSTLICAKFQDILVLDFGEVRFGQTHALHFNLKNPSSTRDINISVAKISTKNGLSIALGEENHAEEVHIASDSSVPGIVFWNPSQNHYKIREIIGLKMDGKSPLQITIHGVCGNPDLFGGLDSKENQNKSNLTQKNLKTRSSLSTTTSAGLNKSLTSTVSLEDQSLLSKSRASIGSVKSKTASIASTIKTSHTTASTQKKINMKDDEWMQKQAKCFQDWMNYSFAKAHVIPNHNLLETSTAANDHNNTAEYASGLKAVMEQQIESKYLSDAMDLFQDEDLQSNVHKLEEEIEMGHLSFREDRNIQSDIGLHEALAELLFTYDYVWLQLGLQVIFCQHEAIIPAALLTSYHMGTNVNTKGQNKDELKIKSLFKAFINKQLLQQDFIAATQSLNSTWSSTASMSMMSTTSFNTTATLSNPNINKHSMLYGANHKKYRVLLEKDVMKKVLSLVLFLDIARQEMLLPRGNLFQRTTAISGKTMAKTTATTSNQALMKSSKEILLAFSRQFLKGEGDFHKHLTAIGYEVQFQQQFIDEFDYYVTDIFQDLRDGVRLAKLMDILVGDNAVDELTFGIQGTLTEHVRAPAISRLQKIHNVNLVLQGLLHHQQQHAIDGQSNFVAPSKDKFVAEVKSMVDGNAEATLLLLWKLMYCFDLQLVVEKALIVQEVQMILQDKRYQSLFANEDEMLRDIAMFATTCETLQQEDNNTSIEEVLWLWCQTIVQPFGISLSGTPNNFSAALCDSKVLAMTIYYYHPTLFHTHFLKKKVTSNMSTALTRTEMQSILMNENRNFLIFQHICKSIGGIPMILHDMSSLRPAEEKTMVIFLGYFFTRLTESSKQIRAAIVIQAFYRKFIHVWRAKKQALSEVVLQAMKNQKKKKETTFKRRNFPQHSLHFLSPKKKVVAPVVEADEEMKAMELAETLEMNDDELLNSFGLVSTTTTTCASEQDDSIDHNDIMALSTIIEEHVCDEEDEEDCPQVNESIELKVEELYPEQQVPSDEKTLCEYMQFQQQQEEESFDNDEQLRLEVEAAEIEKMRMEAELAEVERLRLEAEAAEKERLRLEAEAAEMERLRLEANAAEVERLRLEAEAAEAAEVERLRLEAEAAEAAEKERLRLEAEAAEVERLRLEAEAAEVERLRLEAEAAEAAEVERLRLEAETAEMERLRLEAEAAEVERLRLEAEAAEMERLRLEAEAAEKERLRLEAEAAEMERLRLEAEAAEVERLRLEAEAAEMERLRLEAEAAEMERLRLENERIINFSATMIQAQFRGCLQFRRFKCALLAVQIIQDMWRKWQVAKLYEKMKIAANKIRQHVLGYLARKQFILQKASILKIQSTIRMMVERKQFAHIVHNITTIQQWWHSAQVYQKRQAIEDRRLRMANREAWVEKQVIKHAANKIKSFFQMVLQQQIAKRAYGTIVNFWQSRIAFIRAKKLNRGFARLRAVMRSRMIRKMIYNKNEKLLIISKNLKLLRQKALENPALLLSAQVSHALLVLQQQHSSNQKMMMISQYIKACSKLQYATELCYISCERFVNASHCVGILFDLLQSCNRSTPHQELLRVCLHVLMNICHYPKLAAIVGQEANGVEALCDLLQMFRDKKSVFTLAAEMLSLVVKANPKTKELCNTPVYRKRLDGISHIIERKNKMETKIREVDSSMGHRSAGRERKRRLSGELVDQLESVDSIRQLMAALA